MRSRDIDEILEAIWKCREDGDKTVEQVLVKAEGEASLELIKYTEQKGLVRVSGEDIFLTDEGDKRAARLIRRHRLAERLFTDILGVSEEACEEAACYFEHGVVAEVTESLCTLLGHPRECPDGKPIPLGDCCRQQRTEVGRAMIALAEASCGESYKVAYVRPREHDRLHMLLSTGISPGVKVRIHQKSPVLVVEVETSEFAMDHEVAEDIYVWAN
jgi:DtxR family Mn-dependent transcriptional regulator